MSTASVLRRVLVFNLGAEFLGGTADALRAAGAEVQVFDDSRSLGSIEAVKALMAHAWREGAPDLVLISATPDALIRSRPLHELDLTEWRRDVTDGLRLSLWLLQSLSDYVKAGDAIVMIGPSLSLVGAPDLVGLSTLLEGQRGLMKSVARQWGARGVTLNWIAMAPCALSDRFQHARLAAKPDAVSVALSDRPRPARDLPGVLAFLARGAMTGMTLTLDGGEWMVP